MWRPAVAAAAIAVATVTPGAHAATIGVTTIADTVGVDGVCSLREALTSANLDTPSSTATGECAGGSGADTITLPIGTLGVHGIDTGEDGNQTGDLDATGATTIQGAGALLTTLQADGHDRVLDVIAGGALTISGVTITGGAALDGGGGSASTGADGNPAGDVTGGAGTPGASGGGIRSAGTLEIRDSVIAGNSAGDGGKGGLGTGGNGDLGTSGAAGGDGYGGAAGRGGDGGGIWSSGPLVLARVVVTDNHAGAGGLGGTGQGGVGGLGTGGVGGTGGYGTGGLSGFGGDGGGIYISGGAARVQDSTIRTNSAGASGTGGAGKGGQGGVAGPNPSTGGVGGGATGGVAEEGGSGGGIGMGIGSSLVATGNLIEGNTGGQGGVGGAAIAAKGGNSTNGAGGHGGNAIAAPGAGGGSTGGVGVASGSLSDSTITANRSALGGVGGAATGGNGGVGTLGTGSGGDALGGDGGTGGGAGGVGANDTAIVHVTITANTLGGAASGGAATAGTGSTSGTAESGGAGSAFGSGAIFAAGTTSLANSIVATNSVPGCTNGLQDLGGNLSLGDPSCPGTDADALLGPLADNGGPTLTRRPGDGSPAVDGAVAGGCTPTDQRGVARPFGAACDIGAYERAAPLVAITAAAPTVQGTVTPNGASATYHFDYGTTTTYGSSTPDATAGGTAPAAASAALPGLAPGTTYHVRLVATNPDGTSATADGTFTTATATQPDTTAPVILSASAKPKSFRRRRGTTLRYRLSEPARVVFTVQRRKGKRFVEAKTFSKASKQGANTRKLVTRKLKPGRYRATLVATDAAKNRSKPKRVTFRVRR